MIFIRKKIRQQAITCQRIFLDLFWVKEFVLSESRIRLVHQSIFTIKTDKKLSFEILNHSYLIHWTAASCWPARLRAYQTAQVYHILIKKMEQDCFSSLLHLWLRCNIFISLRTDDIKHQVHRRLSNVVHNLFHDIRRIS